jgi:hypothetical protein
VLYSINKDGPSTISNASLEILLPTDVIELENVSYFFQSKNLGYFEKKKCLITEADLAYGQCRQPPRAAQF